MSSFHNNHWKNYQNQISKYLLALENNPYFEELKQDFENKKLTKILDSFKKEYAGWISELIRGGTFSERWIDNINSRFTEDRLMTYFSNYIEKNVEIGNVEKLKDITRDNNLNEVLDCASNEVLDKFKPSDLRFVTTTAVAFIDVAVDFKIIYNHFDVPRVILENPNCDKKNPVFDDSVIGKVVGCKYGNFPIKGFFKKDTIGDFYNCATVLVCLDKYKTANVKIFNNGKLQITGAPRQEEGHRAVSIVGQFIQQMPFYNASTPIQMINYKTEMINTCYELGFSINRETLYEILTKKFKLTTTYNTEGYPGVRLHYFYNDQHTGTAKEGSCHCNPCCSGKGTGTGGSNCRKLSIAIFQYGSVIIAGGCDNDKPILTAYHFVNRIISTIIQDIKKDSVVKKNKRYQPNKKPKTQYTLISKDQINLQLYQLLLNKNI